jgi:hypothetical protein
MRREVRTRWQTPSVPRLLGSAQRVSMAAGETRRLQSRDPFGRHPGPRPVGGEGCPRGVAMTQANPPENLSALLNSPGTPSPQSDQCIAISYCRTRVLVPPEIRVQTNSAVRSRLFPFGSCNLPEDAAGSGRKDWEQRRVVRVPNMIPERVRRCARQRTFGDGNAASPGDSSCEDDLGGPIRPETTESEAIQERSGIEYHGTRGLQRSRERIRSEYVRSGSF